MDIFVVYIYCDYRKEVNLQHLKAFKCREQAIQFALKYSDSKYSKGEYTLIKGSEYDARLYYPDEESENYEEMEQKYKNMKKELNIRQGLWHMRIAVDKVELK